MRRPHPATVIATIALVGAWGGPAVARTLFTGADVTDGSLTGRDVRNGSLSGIDLRRDSVTGRAVARLSGRDILSDSLDGGDIVEQTLEKVPSAETADSVGGVGAARISFIAGPGADEQVLDAGGLRLRARCQGGDLTVTATAAEDGGAVRSVRFFRGGVGSYSEDDDFRAGDSFDVLPQADDVQGTLHYLNAAGGLVTLDFIAEVGVVPGRTSTGCAFAGTALHRP